MGVRRPRLFMQYPNLRSDLNSASLHTAQHSFHHCSLVVEALRSAVKNTKTQPLGAWGGGQGMLT